MSRRWRLGRKRRGKGGKKRLGYAIAKADDSYELRHHKVLEFLKAFHCRYNEDVDRWGM